MSSPYRDEIVAACTKHRVDPFLVEAMVTVESSHHADAFRHEAGFWRRYLVDNPTYMHQVPRRVSSSYGLMQIMYPVACERGFKGEPERLFSPTVNLEYGVRHLTWLLAWAAATAPSETTAERERAAVAAYNGGRRGNRPPGPYRNHLYLRKVMSARARIRRRG